MWVAQGTACRWLCAIIRVVKFGHMWEVWFQLAHGTACIWNYSFAQHVGKPITVYSLRERRAVCCYLSVLAT